MNQRKEDGLIKMSKITFVKPTHIYESYLDFWRLVNLCGFPTIYENELDITKEGIYIVTPMNGNYIEHMAGDVNEYQKNGEISGGEIKRQPVSGLQRQAHIIIWNLERPSGSGSLPEYGRQCKKWMDTRLADEVWLSDPFMADETQMRFVFLGSHPGLGELSDEKEFDFCHMSMVNPRRTTIYKHFADGFKVGPNCWPPERDDVLKKSKFALNVHQDNYPYVEPLRFALFAAYGLPIISEVLSNGHPYSDIVHFGYHNLVAGLKVALTNDYEQWKERGEKLHQRLCYDLQFGNVVRQAVKETGINWR